jgi:hypothetical protein
MLDDSSSASAGQGISAENNSDTKKPDLRIFNADILLVLPDLTEEAMVSDLVDGPL